MMSTAEIHWRASLVGWTDTVRQLRRMVADGKPFTLDLMRAMLNHTRVRDDMADCIWRRRRLDSAYQQALERARAVSAGVATPQLVPS